MSGLNFTESQKLTLQLAPKFTATLSIIGSSIVIYEVLTMRKSKLRTRHFILFNMSCVDVLNSFALFCTIWPIPKPDGFGNVATCNVQGFFVQFGTAIILWNGVLAATFLLKIRHNWPEVSDSYCLFFSSIEAESNIGF